MKFNRKSLTKKSPYPAKLLELKKARIEAIKKFNQERKNRKVSLSANEVEWAKIQNNIKFLKANGYNPSELLRGLFVNLDGTKLKFLLDSNILEEK